MASRGQRFLAKLDELLASILHLETWETNPGMEGAASRKSFWIGWGRKFLILDKNGLIRSLGNSWQIEHLYDGSGHLICRKRFIKFLCPEEHLVFGFRQVYDLWCTQQQGIPFPK